MGSQGPHDRRALDSGPGRGLSPADGAAQAEKRLGKPCFHGGQKVAGLYGCVACQFQIMNRGTLPTCPNCGEIIWCYLGDGPRPVPEGEAAAPAPASPDEAPAAVEENVKLDAPVEPVKVEENVKLDP